MLDVFTEFFRLYAIKSVAAQDVSDNSNYDKLHLEIT